MYCPNVKILVLCSSAIEGRKAVLQYQSDLVFLDIEMPEGDGFSFLESISNINFEVIFVTAHDQYGIKAIKFCALDYLLKPIDILELTHAFEKVEKALLKRSDNLRMKTLLANRNTKSEIPKIALPLSDKIEFVEISSIICCEGDGNYTHIHIKNSDLVLVSKTLKEYDELLTEHNFIRVHQSHLINLNEIKAYIKTDGGYIKLKDGTSISISRQRREIVMERLKGL